MYMCMYVNVYVCMYNYICMYTYTVRYEDETLMSLDQQAGEQIKNMGPGGGPIRARPTRAQGGP